MGAGWGYKITCLAQMTQQNEKLVTLTRNESCQAELLNEYQFKALI
jgi:hypothetical protein